MTSPKPKVVITRNLIDEAQQILDEKSSELEIVHWKSDQPCPRSWLLENVPNATALLIMLSDTIDPPLLTTAGPSLKAIASFSVGTDHIDLAALKARHIRLGYTPTVLTDAVADLTVMLTLMAQRRAGEALRRVARGEWPHMPWHPLLMTGPGLRGKTVGFLGFGRIAQAALGRFLGFGVKRAVYVTSRAGGRAREDYFGLLGEKGSGNGNGGVHVEPVGSVEELARTADVLVVSCSLTLETRHLVDAEFFERMQRHAVIVNIARGPVVDTNALVEALDKKQIFGAGLDVVEGEPEIAEDHPLLKQERCVLLPHVGSATVESRRGMAVESVRNLLAGLEGGEMVNEKVL